MRSFRFPALLLLTAICAGAAIQPVRARKAMVATVEPNATDAGLETLRAGGNAVDAAVAIGFALAVTHPSAGNLGGGGFMLIRFADGRTTFLDFRERAPESASRNMYLDAQGNATKDSQLGYRAAGVPGTARGLELAWKKYGSRKWAELVQPSVKLAQQGFALSYGLARGLRNTSKLGQFAESKRIFHKGGAFWEAGEIFRQPDLAGTLARIRDRGAADFYEGETARRLADDMARNGGHITLADLKGYEVVERKPLTGSYRGYGIVTAPPPSSGGIGILQMLGVLEPSDFAARGASSAHSLHWIAEAMRRYFADRSEHLGDPDFFNVQTGRLLHKDYIARLRASIDPQRATSSTDIKPGNLSLYESAETTHYSVVDAQGNAVAVTYTLNGGYGAGVTATGLGFLLNNEMDDFAAKPGFPNFYGLVQGEGNAIQPRKRPLSSMTPTVVTRDGKLYLVAGSPGGPTIINTVLQILINIIDFGMNAQEAVNFPRIHHQWIPDELRMEKGFSPDTVDLLKARGHKIREGVSQGEVSAIRVVDGWLEGAADPRTEGTAKGY